MPARSTLACLVVCACSSSQPSPAEPATASAETSLTLTFSIDAPAGGEAYECFGFDASPLAGRWLRAIRWTPPPAGGVALHHAALYAFPKDYPDGPVACLDMPAAWTMHIWAPGGDPLTLPDDVAIALPPGTRRFVVQAHVLRTAGGPASPASATLDTTGAEPAHVAAWLPAVGTVPAIRPHSEEHSTGDCTAAAPMHVVTAWPHMHRIGTSFQSAIVRADGSREVVVDVPAWSFDRQQTYAVDRDLAAGDRVESDCTWFNPTDAYVLPGYSTSDEMCGQGLIVWPAEAAAWAPGCP